MLIDRTTLEGIAAGRVSLAFRRWRRPTVKSGGTLRTALGLLAIDAVGRVTVEEITEADARAAGFAERDALLAALDRRSGGELYRIAFGPLGPDPRVALRERATITDEEVAELDRRLARSDASSREGPWTGLVLGLIRDRPATNSRELAASTPFGRRAFKAKVRRLKALGLTESLAVGYRLSPRGEAYLERRGRGPRSGQGAS